MRPPATIKPWLPIGKMFRWLQDAPDEASHKRRLAVWLTHTSQLHANRVADALGVSTAAVWAWIRQYNALGPDGLERAGRGGRRWGFLTPQQEADLVEPFLRRARAGRPPRGAEVRQAVEEMLGKPVSLSCVYRLLHRHGWATAISQSHAGGATDVPTDTFHDIARPWRRET